MGDGEYGIDSKVLSDYANEIQAIVTQGIELAIVIAPFCFRPVESSVFFSNSL